MTIKQKIKKWHVVVLIILGIGGYWLSQNMWVFEKQIPVEQYEEFLIGTEWSAEERSSTWIFNDNSVFIEKSNYEYSSNEKATWRINFDEINIKYEDHILPSIWSIIFLNEENMTLLLMSPSVNGRYKIKLIRNEE